jgi:hypothetical protein
MSEGQLFSLESDAFIMRRVLKLTVLQKDIFDGSGRLEGLKPVGGPREAVLRSERHED